MPPLAWGGGGDGALPGGFSLEVLFKADTIERWAKVFDFGNGPERDNSPVGYEDTSATLRLEQWTDWSAACTPCWR